MIGRDEEYVYYCTECGAISEVVENACCPDFQIHRIQRKVANQAMAGFHCKIIAFEYSQHSDAAKILLNVMETLGI